MAGNLIVLAGNEAGKIVRDGGFTPDRIQVVAGAAGGPKWLVLDHLDRALFGQWFAGRTAPLYLIGASIGAWRFAGVTQRDALEAISRFESLYLGQQFSDKPDAEEISNVTRELQRGFVTDQAIPEILSHPYLRLNVLSVRCKSGLTASENRVAQVAGFLGATLLNVMNRNALGLLFERALFYDPRERPPFFNMDQFPMKRVALSPENLRPALLASGAIPLVMQGVTDIPGAPPGMYRDAGILDYHMDMRLSGDDQLVLFPHFMDHIVPGWLDKRLKWRRPSADRISRTVMIAPSPEFVQRLPYGKITDRNDFYMFHGRDRERIAYWKKVIEAGRMLADEFLELTASGRIREVVKPF